MGAKKLLNRWGITKVSLLKGRRRARNSIVRPLKGRRHTQNSIVRPLTGAADENRQVFNRWGLNNASSPKLTILKLTGTACLVIALISILTINLISSNYGTTPASAAGFTVTGPATIGISLPGLTKDPNTGKYSVPTMTIPNNNGQGGIAITKHSIEVTSTSIGGYSTTIKADSNSNQLKGMVLILLTLLIQWLVLRLTQYH